MTDVVEVAFDASAYSIDAIQRAAYKFTGQFSLEIRHVGQDLACLLHPVTPDGVDEALVGQFRTEALDQMLRERIRGETEGVRNVILALAFSEAQLDGE